MQHDLDASPIFPRFEVPLTGHTRFATDTAMSDGLAEVSDGEARLPGHTSLATSSASPSSDGSSASGA